MRLLRSLKEMKPLLHSPHNGQQSSQMSSPLPQGFALIFIPAGGGTPPPWIPSPPPPSAQVHPKTWVLGTFFIMGKVFWRLRHMPYTVFILLHVCSISLVFQTTMPQRSLLV